ncbi:hypothetical protein [Streptomyces sp. NBC_00334]|uniref:hypothetical protein n=1 Tax=Streptomyces sp. NBC_00334 TaxID=2975713 RepID=UPI002E2E151D|nr:hypothetical protein [Streptomyces sp. NBC_00334]
MTHERHRLAITAVLAAAVVLTGCQGGSDTDSLSLSSLTKTADAVPDDGTDSCPLPYDISEAAKTAGTDGTAGLGPAQAEDAPIATVEGGKRAEPGDPLAVNSGVLISCTFHIGQDDVQVHTVATRERHAIYPLAPVVSSLASLSGNDATGYVEKAADAETGKVVSTDSGNVASVRLKLDGEGDAALLVGAGKDGHTSLSPEQVGNLAQVLAEQIQ